MRTPSTVRATRPDIPTIGTIAVFALALLMMAWRIGVGAGLSGDEAYSLSTAYRYVLGDRPLLDSWDTNFSSAIVMMPYVWSYLLLTGGTDGILIGPRVAFLLMNASTAALAYAALRGRLARPLATTMSLLLFVYLPFLSPGAGYGFDYHWHIISGFSLYYLWHRPSGRAWMPLLPGIAAGLGVIGNPPTIIVIPFVAGTLWFMTRNGASQARSTDPWWYLVGAGLVGAGLLSALLALAGPNLFSELTYVMRPDDHSFAAGDYLGRITKSKWMLVGPIAVGSAAALASRAWPRARLWLPATALAASVTSALLLLLTGRLLPLAFPQSAIAIAAASMLIFTALSKPSGDNGSGRALLLATAIGAGLGWLLGSNAGIHSAVLAAPLALAAALDGMRTPDPTSGPAGRVNEMIRAMSIALLIIAVAFVGVTRAPEGKTRAMNRTVRRGPFKGIRDTPSRARLHEEYVDDLEHLPRVGGRVVYVENFPLGYLITPNLPGTYSTWATNADSSRLRDYLRLNPNTPERIVLTRYAMNDEDGPAIPNAVNLASFPSQYRLVFKDEHFRVYDRAH